jgi:hypothetical protein
VNDRKPLYTPDPRRVLALSGALARYRDVVLGLKSVLHGTGPENFGWMVGRLPWARTVQG